MANIQLKRKKSTNMTIWSPTIYHSALGRSWKKHKYIRKEGDRYIYNNVDKRYRQAAKEQRAAIRKDRDVQTSMARFERWSGPKMKNTIDRITMSKVAESRDRTAADDTKRLLRNDFMKADRASRKALTDRVRHPLKYAAKEAPGKAKKSLDKAILRGKQKVHKFAAKARIFGRKLKRR